MADELSKPPYNRSLPIPTAYNWESLTGKRGAELEVITPPCFVNWDIKKEYWDKFLLSVLQGIIARDKTSLDITWLKDRSLADLATLSSRVKLNFRAVRTEIYGRTSVFVLTSHNSFM